MTESNDEGANARPAHRELLNPQWHRWPFVFEVYREGEDGPLIVVALKAADVERAFPGVRVLIKCVTRLDDFSARHPIHALEIEGMGRVPVLS